jgi:hypothetical protein
MVCECAFQQPVAILDFPLFLKRDEHSGTLVSLLLLSLLIVLGYCSLLTEACVFLPLFFVLAKLAIVALPLTHLMAPHPLHPLIHACHQVHYSLTLSSYNI